MSDERRDDMGQRDRVAAIDTHLRAVLRRQWIAIGILYATVLLGLGAFGWVVHTINTNRYDALVQLCQQTNAEHQGIRAFVVATAPGLAERVATAFPDEPSCDRYARRFASP